MSKKNVIRRVVALGICLLFAIVALLFPNNKAAVRAGAGNGTNAKVETTAELSALLGQVADQMEHSETNPLASLAASKSPEYESVTVEDALQISLEIKVGQASSTSRIDRRMTAYLTEDATYYVSDATISSSYKTPERTESGKVVQEEIDRKTDSSLRLHIYRDQKVCMIMFDRFTSIINGTNRNLPASILGKWIAFSAEDDYGIYNEVTSIDGHNFAVLTLMGNMLGNESNFERSGDTYKMTEKAFLSFLAALEKIDGVDSSYVTERYTGKGSFVANVINSRRPRITIDCKDSYSDSDSAWYSDTSTRFTVDLAQTEELIFTNIDNTVIREPSERSTITPEELANALFEEWGE